jgi:alpha-tubulin suppressor-like RCC1 family protein
MYHTCAVTIDGAAWCWGRNLYGALGTGLPDHAARPARVAGDARFTVVSAGWDHTCALDTRGAAWCWGMNFSGQVGDGTTEHRGRPALVSGGHAFSAISAGEAHTCGIAADGVYCWGADLSPWPNGDPPGMHRLPTRLPGPVFGTLSVGYEIACGLTAAGAPYCWGLVPPGVALPDSSFHASPTPLPVADPAVLAAVSAGFKHACGLDAAGAAFCWGRNDAGQLGDGTLAGSDTLRRVAGGLAWRAVSAHAPFHSCGIDTTERAHCWGRNGVGQLGDGTLTSSTVPVAVADDLRFAEISAGGVHSCGLTLDRTVYCWGGGRDGQLGDGAQTSSSRPVAITP